MRICCPRFIISDDDNTEDRGTCPSRCYPAECLVALLFWAGRDHCRWGTDTEIWNLQHGPSELCCCSPVLSIQNPTTPTLFQCSCGCLELFQTQDSAWSIYPHLFETDFFSLSPVSIHCLVVSPLRSFLEASYSSTSIADSYKKGTTGCCAIDLIRTVGSHRKWLINRLLLIWYISLLQI